MSAYKSFDQMIEAAKAAISESSQESSVYIGCDSARKKKNGKFFATYATVVILHRDSKHGAQMFSYVETQQDYSAKGEIKQRLMNEVNFAVAAGLAICDVVEDRPFEIHLDINKDPRHKSNVAMKEACGWVLGTFGIEATLKPDGFAATHAADHLVRH